MSWKQAPHAVMQKKSHVPVPVGHNAMGDNEEDTPPAPKVRTRGHRNNGKFFPENIASVQSGNCHHFSGKNVAVPPPECSSITTYKFPLNEFHASPPNGNLNDGYQCLLHHYLCGERWKTTGPWGITSGPDGEDTDCSGSWTLWEPGWSPWGRG